MPRVRSRNTRRFIPLQNFAQVSMALALASSCSSSRVAPAPAPVSTEVIYTMSYATINGTDTMSLEIVTRCFGRLLSDVSVYRQGARGAHVHYEVEFGPKQLPRSLTFATWVSEDSVSRRPDQVAHTYVRGDSVFTEVWRGGDHQLQSAALPANAFLWVGGYAGLLGQLLAAVTENSSSTTLPLFYISTRGHTGVASIKRITADSAFITLDSTQIATRWTSAAGLRGAQLVGGPIRVDLIVVPAQGPINALCARPPFGRDST